MHHQMYFGDALFPWDFVLWIYRIANAFYDDKTVIISPII